MTEAVQTTISVAHRTLTQLLANGRTVRYALAAGRDGDISWREDTFACAEDPVQPLRWLSCRGPLTVASVIEAVPDCEATIRAWTQSEVDDAFAAADLEELARQRRRTAQLRLREELTALHAGAA